MWLNLLSTIGVRQHGAQPIVHCRSTSKMGLNLMSTVGARKLKSIQHFVR